jgi:cytochrome P450
MPTMITTGPVASTAPPGPRGVPLLGNLLDLARDQLGFVRECTRRYGDLVSISYGGRRAVIVNHPDDVEFVLVKNQRMFPKGSFYGVVRRLLGDGLLVSDGDIWRRQRHLTQPAFHHERIDSYAQIMAEYAQQTLAPWHDGEERDVHAEITRLALRVVGKTMFDSDIEHTTPVVATALPRALAEVSAQMNGPEFLLPDAVPTPSRRRLRKAVAELDAVVYRIIAERRADGRDHGDLLSAFMDARDDDGAGMSDRLLRDEVMTILLAGHETTALALTWALMLLSDAPAVRARLEEEVDAVLGGLPPGLADVPRLPFTEAVLLEAMRLYPPLYGTAREVTQRCEIGGYTLEPKTFLIIVPWNIQRDERWFPDPEEFRPERWLDGLAKRLPRFAYFPFNGGPRLCPGQRFGMLEAELVLSSIVQRWRLDLLPGQDLRPVTAISMRPKRGVRMLLTARKDGVPPPT